MLALVGAATGLAGPPVAGSADLPPHPARAALVASALRAEPGAAVEVGVLIELEPGWHVYWKNPGDAGLATRVEVRGPEAAAVGELLWPLPRRFEEPGGIVAYGYADKVLLARRLTLPTDLPLGAPVRVAVEASWLVCRERCLEGGFAGEGLLQVKALGIEANREAFRRFGGPRPSPRAAGAGEPFVLRRLEADGERAAYELAWTRPVEAVEVFPAPEDDLEARVTAIHALAATHTRVELSLKSYVTGASLRGLPVLVVFRYPGGERVGVETIFDLAPR